MAFFVHLFGLALILLLLAFSCDTFDGMIARSRNECSQVGHFLDTSIDRLGEAVWFYGIFLSGVFPVEAVLLLAMSSFLINYFRVQLVRVFGENSPGFIEKGERNIYFVFLVSALVLGVNTQILIQSFWLVCILSVGTVIQLFARGLRQAKRGRSGQTHKTDPIRLLEDPSDYFLGGT